MGTIVVHAGMGKAGSSSIQDWIAQQVVALRERDVETLVARVRREGDRAVDLEVAPYESGQLQSNEIVTGFMRDGLAKEAVLDRVVSALDGAADRHRLVLLTAEALQRLLWAPDEDFLAGLQQLAGRHRVRVAYYVRPQHSALEAYWRQWGFRSGHPPSVDLTNRARALHYAPTREYVGRLAPEISFEVRPFRRDLLDHGDPVTDFARAFLGIEDAVLEGAGAWTNRGLPLEVINALRHAPEGVFWTSESDNEGLGQVKRILGGIDAPEREETRTSRAVLQAFCHDTFEADNRRLIAELGWNTDAFVPPVELDPALRGQGLEALDGLWESPASELELQSLFAALERAIAARQPTRSPARAATPPPRLRARMSDRLAQMRAGGRP